MIQRYPLEAEESVRKPANGVRSRVLALDSREELLANRSSIDLPNPGMLAVLPEKLTIVIPAYNEEERISETVHDYAAALRDTHHEIVVELDGCNDGTADRVRDIRREFPLVKLIEFRDRLGKGAGVFEGMRQGTGEWVGYVDADGSTPPGEFFRVAETALSDGADAVIATRYWNRQEMLRQYGFLRWTLSRGFNFAVRHLFGLPFRDTQCGAKVFRRRAVDAVAKDMEVTGYAFDVELLWRLGKAGFRIREIPILWNYRDGSTVRLPQVASRMFLDVLRLRVNP